MKKSILIASVAMIGLASCNKNESTPNTINDMTMEDSLSMNTSPYDQEHLSDESATPQAVGDVVSVRFLSEDGNTPLQADFNAVDETATLTNEATQDKMFMKKVPSASGDVYRDDKGHTFSVHQGKFYLEKDGKQVLSGTEVTQ